MLPFSMLLQIAGPSEHVRIWSAEQCLQGWLAFERALVLAQADEGIVSVEHAEAIVAAAHADRIDRDELWATARVVGYPILGLVRQIARATHGDAAGRVHFGATTQDVMDTATALQMQRSLTRLDHGLAELGAALAATVDAHRLTVMPARTHAQQAVPTTFGATLATSLAQLVRHRQRIDQARPRVEVVSLYGAGGTGAAYGDGVASVRRGVAERLGLGVRDVSWHAERDGIAEFGWLCVTIAATCARLAKNVVDLSRTEIGEVRERFSAHRGASSTMPQKVNSISSEVIVGLAASASALASALPRMQEAGHERAAGEWHIEWHVIPQLAELAGRALAESAELVEGLHVDADRMRENLSQDGGLVMAEATMIRLADSIGQSAAHDLVYAAAQRVRSARISLTEAVRDEARGAGVELPDLTDASTHDLGEAAQICRRAIDEWRAHPAPSDLLVDQAMLAQL